MKAPVETVRINSKGRDQLIKLKRQTGIDQWNIICRWALCVSLREPSTPPPNPIGPEQGVEISWRVFSGENSELYSAMIYMRCLQDGLETSPEELSHCIRDHIHRGLGFLCSGKNSLPIDLFLKRWLQV